MEKENLTKQVRARKLWKKVRGAVKSGLLSNNMNKTTTFNKSMSYGRNLSIVEKTKLDKTSRKIHPYCRYKCWIRIDSKFYIIWERFNVLITSIAAIHSLLMISTQGLVFFADNCQSIGNND